MFILKIEEYLSRIPLMMKLIYYDCLGRQGLSYSDISYGTHKRQYYRLYRGNKKNLPTVFFIHGGGWWHGSPRFFSAIGKFFCKRGYTTVLPAYRLVPYATYPNQIEDIATAFSKFVASQDIKPKSIMVIGFSAGGELAARLVFDKKLQNKYNINPNVFSGMLSLAGVLDFETHQSSYAKLLIKNYLSGKYTSEETNPKRLIYKSNFPVFCVHGVRDKLIEPCNAISFAKRVKEVGGESYLYLIRGYHHSDILNLFIGKGQKETPTIIHFIRTHLK